MLSSKTLPILVTSTELGSLQLDSAQRHYVAIKKKKKGLPKASLHVKQNMMSFYEMLDSYRP